MRANLLSAAVLLCLVCFASAGWKWGPCRKQNLQPDFDLDKYLGGWQEAVRTKGIPFESGDCVYAKYSLRDDGFVKVNNTEILQDGQIRGGVAKAYQSKQDPARIKVSFFWPIYANYDVIETDYSDYSVVLSCQNYWLFHQDYAWILTRNSDFDASSKIDVLENIGIDRSDLIIHDLSECPEDV